jgi:hypothetical protein
MPCCGRPAFITSPARWEIISTLDQFRQLCDGSRTVYLAFDADANGSGQRPCATAYRIVLETRLIVRSRSLPEGHDPNSFFANGGDARRFQLAPGGLLGHDVSRVANQPAPARTKSVPRRRADHRAGRLTGSIGTSITSSVRRVSGNTLRSYAHELLHFLRWWESVHHTDAVAEGALTESTLLDYVRFQSGQQPRCGLHHQHIVLPLSDKAPCAFVP